MFIGGVKKKKRKRKKAALKFQVHFHSLNPLNIFKLKTTTIYILAACGFFWAKIGCTWHIVLLKTHPKWKCASFEKRTVGVPTSKVCRETKSCSPVTYKVFLKSFCCVSMWVFKQVRTSCRGIHPPHWVHFHLHIHPKAGETVMQTNFPEPKSPEFS